MNEIPRINTRGGVTKEVAHFRREDFIYSLRDPDGNVYEISPIPIGTNTREERDRDVFLSTEKELSVVSDYNAGMLTLKICSKHKIATNTLSKIMRKYGVKGRYKGRRKRTA